MNIKLEENVNKDLLNECPICSSDVDEEGYCAKHGLPVLDCKDSDDDEVVRQKLNNWFARMGW